MNDNQSQNYKKQLSIKIDVVNQLFDNINVPELEIFSSPNKHFRMRAEFRIWHTEDKINYVMFKKGEKNKPYVITDFENASESINNLMPSLLEVIERNSNLKKKLFQIDFLATTTQQLLITLLYHKELDEQWRIEAKKLEDSFNCFIVGRARKQKITISQDFVIEKFQLDNGEYQYQQVENSFTQPNANICQKMLSWAIVNTNNSHGDLLELYCGNGNFTLPLSKNFNRVLATEVSKTSVKSALYNLELNKITNVSLVRLSSEEITQALNKVRDFRRLKDIILNDYKFHSVFVDPPRAGLDEGTLALISQFSTIIYISCNPKTLIENLLQLSNFKIRNFALFDQFPFTDHIECGVILEKKSHE